MLYDKNELRIFLFDTDKGRCRMSPMRNIRISALILLAGLAQTAGSPASFHAQELPPDELRIHTRQIKSKDPVESHGAAWRLAAHYRMKGELKRGEELLKTFATPLNFERLPGAVALERLRCILEMAHIKALREDVSGSLALLNWAEQRKNDFHRSLSLIKYAEILLDLSEFERCGEYQKAGAKIIVKHIHAGPEGAAIGQGEAGVDKSGAWNVLKRRSDDLAKELEFESLKEQYGLDYALYAKLRRCQAQLKRHFIPRYRKEAFEIADEIIASAPKSQFAAAAEYLKCEIPAARLTEQSDKKQIKEAKDRLEKFIRKDPGGLYRGEALMQLGRISLECEWNAKESQKYYEAALAYFRDARKRKDLFSLYAPMSDDLKRQTAPTQKPTSLDRWLRIIRHEEDPLKLYNIASAPAWYADDKEKNCIFILGFFAFAAGKYDTARSYWENVLALSPDIAALDQRLPNVQTRLLQACEMKIMALWPEEKAALQSPDVRFRFLLGEYLILIERFKEAYAVFKKISETSDILLKSTAYMGMVVAVDLIDAPRSKQTAEELCSRVLDQPKLAKEPIYARALFWMGQLKLSRNDLEKDAKPFYERYVKEYPKGRDFFEAKYRLGWCHLKLGNDKEAEKIRRELAGRNSFWHEVLLKDFKRVRDFKEQMKRDKEKKEKKEKGKQK